MKRLFRNLGILLVGACAAALASAQVSVPGLPLPQLPRLPVGTDPVTGTLRTAESALTEVRKLRVRELLRTESEAVESDPDGQPIVRRQVGALSPTPAALERARAAGFTVLRTETLEGLGLTLVVLQVPEGVSTRRALKKLRELDPDGQYDYNHVYIGAGLQPGESVTQAPQATESDAPAPNGLRIGLIDSGVDTAHPVLAGANIVRQGCDGKAFPAQHGTAVASLLVGRGDGFESVIPGATLYAADIFCGHGGGSMALLAIALDWMAREKVAVVNISLVGAKSILLNGLVRAMTTRGFLLVAAVGNDGPTAPPLFPAVLSRRRRRHRRGCEAQGAARGLSRRAGGFCGAGCRPCRRRCGRRIQRDSRHVLCDADRCRPACRIAAGSGSREGEGRTRDPRVDRDRYRQQRH